MESKPFLKNYDLKPEDLGGGVSRQIPGLNSQIVMVKVNFTKRASGSAHSHPHS